MDSTPLASEKNLATIYSKK